MAKVAWITIKIVVFLGQSDHIMSWAALASKTPKHSPQNVRAHEARKLSQVSQC